MNSLRGSAAGPRTSAHSSGRSPPMPRAPSPPGCRCRRTQRMLREQPPHRGLDKRKVGLGQRAKDGRL
eukprot:6027356-Alexandrium_andersonii.AAC.1